MPRTEAGLGRRVGLGQGGGAGCRKGLCVWRTASWPAGLKPRALASRSFLSTNGKGGQGRQRQTLNLIIINIISSNKSKCLRNIYHVSHNVRRL